MTCRVRPVNKHLQNVCVVSYSCSWLTERRIACCSCNFIISISNNPIYTIILSIFIVINLVALFYVSVWIKVRLKCFYNRIMLLYSYTLLIHEAHGGHIGFLPICTFSQGRFRCFLCVLLHAWYNYRFHTRKLYWNIIINIIQILFFYSIRPKELWTLDDMNVSISHMNTYIANILCI